MAETFPAESNPLALMLAFASNLYTIAQSSLFQIMPLLAQLEEAEEEERGYSIEVGLIMLCIILGLIITLRPSKRTVDFKKPKKD